jgi:flagellar assembly factor FliW
MEMPARPFTQFHDLPAIEQITTRFGAVTINREQAVHLPKGMLGMPDKNHFCLTDFPLRKLPSFRLLQCATDVDLSFVVLPIEVQNTFIDEQDLHDACEMLALSFQDIGLLLVTSVHRRMEGVTLSVNVRAPIFIDTRTKNAVQYAMPNNKYEIRHMLDMAEYVREVH